jgi:hypothetical protein
MALKIPDPKLHFAAKIQKKVAIIFWREKNTNLQNLTYTRCLLLAITRV